MALDDLTAPLPEEDFSDFTNPTNLLRAPSWVTATPEVRPQLVDRAMNAFLGELDQKRDKVVDTVNAKGEAIQAPVWSPAGTLTEKGQEFINQTRQLLQTAAQDPEGGIYQDDMSGKWETSHWVGEFGKGPKQKAFDPLHDLEDWRKEKSALDTDTEKAGGTWEQFVEHSNAATTDEAAKIDPANKELKSEWARRMAVADFNPALMGEDEVIREVGGKYIVNPAKWNQIDDVENAINSLPIADAEKKMMLLQQRANVESKGGEIVNAFSAADSGVLGSMVSRPLNDEFMEAMNKPGASAYEFIKANKERFNKDNYGVGQEIAETFRDAVMATGTGALWLGSGGNYTSPMEAFGGLAADSAKAYNNGQAFSIGGIDINRRDLTELTGQLGSFVAMGGMGSLAGRGLAKSGVDALAKGSRFAVGAEGNLVSRAALASVAEREAIAAGTDVAKTFGQKAVSLAKTIGTDSEVILGSLQASGTSYGKTFNDTFERTGNREQAHKEATITGVADGLSAFIATSVMNRFSKGAGKLLDGGENVGGGVVQNIRSRFQGSKGLKEVQEMLGKVAGLESKELRKVVGAGLAQEMNGVSKKLGLRGWGVGGDALAEGIEESMDEVISGAIQSMSHDSKSWTEAEWEQIQNNWQGYVKAGILGAIGGTAGAAQGAATSPIQTFGKSDALQVQQGMWDKIKSNVEKFDLPNMPAMVGTGDPKSVAEYLASDASIEKKSNVLIASARANDLASFANAFNASTPATAPEDTSGAESQQITPSDSESPSGAENAPASGSFGELMTGMKIPLNEGRQWDDFEVSDDKNTYEIPGVGKATLVKANTRNEDGSSTPFNVGVRIVDKDGNSNVLSAEQAASVIPDNGAGTTIRTALRNADSGTLQTLFSKEAVTNEGIASETATGSPEIITNEPSTQEPVTKPEASSAPSGESGSTASSNEAQGGASPAAVDGGSKPPVAGDSAISSTSPAKQDAPTQSAVTFKTSQGSEYVVEGNSTTRNASTNRPAGSQSSQGPQAKSDTTYYVSKQDANERLSLIQAKSPHSMEIASHAEGGLALRYTSGPEKGKWIPGTNVKASTNPSVGSMPVEVWNTDKGQVHHFGNEIVSVSGVNAESSNGAENPDVNETDFANTEGGVSPTKTEANETKPAEPLNPAGEIKTDIQSGSLTKDEQEITEDSLTKDEAGDAKVVSSNIANHEVSVAQAPKVAQQSVKGTGQVSRTHQAELDEQGAETGLYVDRSGKVVVTPALFRKVLAENDGKSKRTAKALSERIAKLKAKPERGFIPINALPVKQKLDAADTLLDPDKRLVVGSDTIENGETDSAGGSWERVVVGKKEGADTPMGAKVFYTYTQPKGSGAPLNQGDIVLINGDSENVLILDNVSNGKWAFRKVSIKPDTINFKSTTLKEKNFAWNRSRLTGVAKQVKPHLAEIVNGTITPADFERLMNEVVKVVAPDFKGTLKKVDFGKDSEEYLQAHPSQDEIWVDYKNLRREFNTLYQAMSLGNDTGNEILSLDVARVMAKMFDEEVIHLLAGKEFKNKELEKWYDEMFGERDEDDAPMGSDHPFRELLLKTAKERFPLLDPESLAIDKHDNAKVVIAHELLRKLQQIRTSGSFTEQATDESQRLQAAMTLDYRDAPGGDAKLAKMMRTVRDMVKRYSDRIRNILWLRWNQGRLPMHQQMLLNRMDAAYKRAGVNGDTEFARENADDQVVSKSDEYEESFRQWANQIGARHYEAQASLRTLAETYANSDYEDLLAVDRETLGMTLAPEVREELAVSDPEALQRIDAMLAEFNDEKPVDGKLVPDNPSLERAKTLMFLRKNVLDSKMALLDFDVTPALDVTSKNGSDVLMRVAELIKNSSPETEHAEQFRRLGLMATDRSNAIQKKIAYIREVAMKKRIAAIRSLDVDTLKGRLAIVKQAEKLGLTNPFNEESATEQDVSPVMQELKDSMTQRVREIAENEVFQVPSEDGPESTTLAELDAQMQQEIAVAQMAEKAFLSAPHGNGEPSQFTRFIEFKRALDAYNRSVTNVKRHALGDFWRKPTRFGLDIRDLSERSGAGEELQFGGSQESLPESLDAEGAFNVSFPRVGESLSFLPARHYPQWEGGLLQPLSEDQIKDNKERDILEQAALSNATFVGRQHWNQFYLQYMMGSIPMNDSPDRYRETAGFALKQMVDPDTKAVRYERPEAAFNPWNRIRLKDLIDAVRKESQNKSRLDGKSQSVDNVKAHLEELLTWAKDISKRVSPTLDKDHAKFEEKIGGIQTLADRTRPLIESQFGNKAKLEPFNPDGTPFDGNNEDNAEWETNGLIPLLENTLIALDKITTPAEAIKLLQGKKSVGGMMTRRLAGANDSVKLARKALKEFKDVTWRRNYEREASVVQRQEAYKPDNKELLELRDSPADIRVFSNLTFTLNYHENRNDYVVSPNFGFEMMRDYRRAFRGEGYVPEVYREVGTQKIYLGHRFDREIIERTGTHPDIPAYSKLEYDSDGIPFYFKQVSRNNFNENVTDRSIYGDDRGNRSQTLEGMTNELGEEQVLTAGANAINQAGSANASQRLWITHSAAVIGSQSHGRNSVDDGRQWFWDLQQMERGELTRKQMEGVIRRGIQGIFPRAHAFFAKGREDFWNEMYNRLPSELTGDMRGSGMGIDGKETLLASELRPSAESVLVALGELKQSFEFELVEQAKAGYQTDRALQTVMDSLAGEREVMVKETKTIETPVANPKFNPEEDSPFSRTKTEPRTIIERKQIEQIRKELRFGASNNTLASPEESEAISNMLRKSLTFEGLAIYDAAMMVHGIDGLGSPTLSLAIQNFPGETLVVAPHENVLNNFGLNDIGLRIFEGKNGNPNVVYVPQSQAKDELSPQEVFSGLAHTLIISANSNEQIKEELAATAKAIRETLEPAIYIQGQMDKWQNHVDTFTRRLEPQTAKLTPAGKRKFRNQVADHLVKLGVLADSLGINQRSANLVSIFPGQDPSLVSDAMLVAELFSNRDAKTLFDEAFLGTDTYNESLLSTPVTDMLHSGIKFPTRPGQGGMYDEDAIANMSEVRDEPADDEEEFEEEEIEGDPNLNALDQVLGNIRNAEQEEAFMSGDLSGGNAMPDARSINNALRKELRRLETVNDSLKAGNLQDNPSDAFLFNSMAAILQNGKAVQSPPMDYRVKGERTSRNILMGRHTADERVKALGGPIMEGRPGGSSKATNIYVGEIRNLTIPKARGATAQRIGFNHRNIQNTSAALTLLAPSVNGAVEEAVRARAGSGLGSAGMRHLGRVEVPVKLTRMVMDDLAESLPEAFILESEKEVREHMAQLDANLVKLEKRKTAFEKHLKELRTKPVTADRIESQKRAENLLMGINQELAETVSALRLADQHTGIELLGIGYWNGMVGAPAQTEPSGRIIRPEVEPHEVNASAIITLMDPSLELGPNGIVTNASLLAREDTSKALERREHYIMKQALVNALNGYARDHVSDQYKLVRNTDDNFLHFDPLKAINRSVKMVRVEDEIMKRLVDEARDDASEANLAGMTAEALAVLTSPNTAEAQEVYINEQGKLRLVSMPKNFMERKDKLGQLVSQDGQKLMLLPKNARDELMRAFPTTFTKRNVNRELSNLALNSLTVSHGTPHRIIGGLDLSKIGTGEGAQVYGYGFYTTSDRSRVAEDYRKHLSSNHGAPNRALYDGEQLDDDFRYAHDLANMWAGPGRTPAEQTKATIDNLKLLIEFNRDNENGKKKIPKWKEIIRFLEQSDPDKFAIAEPGYTYDMEFEADDSELLDFSKTVGEQSPSVINAIRRFIVQTAGGVSKATSDAFHSLQKMNAKDFYMQMSSWNHTETAKSLSSKLRKLGVKGISYMGEYQRTGGEGVRNYVVFDPKDVRITAENGRQIAESKEKELVLNALPVRQAQAPSPGSYSYFLGSSEKQESESFASDDFSLTKGTPMTKGEAAKKFASAWQDGMQEFLNAAMNNGQGKNKSLDLTGNLSKRQIHQFGYMLERLIIAHGDPRLSAKTRKKLNATLDMISEGQISKIGLIGSMPVVDPTRMQQLRIEPLFSKVFSEIEAEEIQKRLIAGLFIVDGKESAIETGVMKYFHHQDARIRNRFRKDYVARQTAMHLNGFLNYGVDGKSGRRGYETAKKEIENSIADKAKKVGPDALNHTIGYLSAVLNGTGQSFGRSRVSSLNWLIKELSGGFIQLEELDNAQDQHFKTKDANGKRRLRGETNRYWNANHIDLLRDTELALKMRDILKESGLSSQFITDEQEAKDLIDHTIKVLESHITDGKVNEVRAYAQEIENQFKDIHSAMQFTMAMLSREEAPDEEKTGESWKDSKRDAFRATYSSVPLRIGYASHPDPKERSVSSGKFISDPADIVSFKDSSFFGGYGKQNDFNNRNKSVFRPIQINGLTAPLSLVDDAVYRLNVTPTYDVLRRAIGRSSSDSHGKTLVRDGDFLEKVQSLRPENDNGTRQWREGYEQAIKKEEMFQEALSGISSELETVIQNDAANGVLNTGGAEVMRFLGSAYIVRSLASIQQLWDQTTGPSVGYSLGKLSVGKGYQVGDYFHILGKLLTDKDFREKARKFIREVDPSVYYRSADGQDITQSVMKSQRRYGVNVVKNKAGKALRKYEEIGEQALNFTIGGGERFIATSMFLTEMMDQMGGITVEELIAKKDEEIPISAKINSKLKVSDVMAQSDQSTKSWMFQNRTSGPARAALWKSLVRFSNHTSSVASNTAVMTPVLFDSNADPQTKLEARENVVTSLAQNLLFYPFKLKTLIPMVAYLLYGLGGDDDDKAQKKAQELANDVMAVDKDSNPLAAILKTLMFGKKREFFQQDKKADAAQASAVAELLSKSAAELATTIPVLGVLAGYSPVSGALQKSITNPLSVEAAAGMNNLVNKRQLKTSNSSYNNNAVSIRSYQDSWGEAIASASAPTEAIYDMGEAAALLTQYNMTRHAKGDRIGSFLDSLLYATTELLPFAREPRSQMKGELQAVIKKEKKR